ncbi:hypothetical protein EJ04DRAFT_476026 [Polyplosphaeria fusca]|uniref:Distal membrane-arm assembly complex protein 1-like domain-containing protein n=1 Tax=Polyplosphaeria fusca TaxID=682080 RepID=A0A9P4QP52_9PLEO|nr:hypothetical protein EJ04DRAFT_476026 [Polyplosphaeria fusca]
MASHSSPSAPPTLKEALKDDQVQYEDCTPCRVMGAGVFIGLGTYTYMSGHSQLKKQEAIIRKSGSMFGMASRRFGITSMAAGLVGMGLYRFFA